MITKTQQYYFDLAGTSQYIREFISYAVNKFKYEPEDHKKDLIVEEFRTELVKELTTALSVPSDIESLYKQRFLEAILRKVQGNKIPERTNKIYRALMEDYPDEMKEVSVEQVGYTISNYNPNKECLGEKLQIELLSESKFSNIYELPKAGPDNIRICKNPDSSYSIVVGHKSSMESTKSFDAIDKGNDIILFVLKTIDIGSFSENKGGGHQDNVKKEIIDLIQCAKQTPLTFDGKNVKIVICIDGRSAQSFIDQCKMMIDNHPNITIGTCASI